MSGLPLSINGHTAAEASSSGQQYGINQSPEIITSVGNGGNIGEILDDLAHLQIPALGSTINNQIPSQADVETPITSSEQVNAAVSTPLGSISTSLNWTWILAGVGIVAILLWKFGRKRN